MPCKQLNFLTLMVPTRKKQLCIKRLTQEMHSSIVAMLKCLSVCHSSVVKLNLWERDGGVEGEDSE